MKEPYVEGLATRHGPESCVCDGDGAGEALAGENAGRLSSSVITRPGRRPWWLKGKATRVSALSQGDTRSRGVVEPAHA
jgi:hypothetical protein